MKIRSFNYGSPIKRLELSSSLIHEFPPAFSVLFVQRFCGRDDGAQIEVIIVTHSL